MKYVFWGVLALALAMIAPPHARAGLITNGGFQSGFTGWTNLDQFGNGSWFVQSGTFSPLRGSSVPPPPEGLNAAMTDQFGPDAHVLFQDFVVPQNVLAAALSFRVFVDNANGNFFNPYTLDPTFYPNQQARVDLMTTAADPFSVAPGDVLQNIFHTAPGDPAQWDGYHLVTVDVTKLLASSGGQTLRLRFAEVDNQYYFNFGVDDVHLDVRTADSPEPAGLMLFGIGAAGLGLGAWRRRRVGGPA